jgi:hypothetical protein
MKNNRLLYPKIYYVFCIFCFFTMGGCVSHRDTVYRFLPDMYNNLKKYPIKIRLQLSDAYQTAKWNTENNTAIAAGPILSRDTKILADKLFELVSVSPSADKDSNVDAILIPEILATNHLMQMFAGQVAKMSITVKWTLETTKGKPIWVQTITGIGTMEMGTSVSEKERLKERSLLAIDDLFIKTANEMSSSIEIQKFSKSLTQ